MKRLNCKAVTEKGLWLNNAAKLQARERTLEEEKKREQRLGAGLEKEREQRLGAVLEHFEAMERHQGMKMSATD